MSKPDEPIERAAPGRPAGKPSLTDSMITTQASALGTTSRLRMLDGLNAAPQPVASGSMRRLAGAVALLLLVAAAGGAWWWTSQRGAPVAMPPNRAVPPALAFVPPTRSVNLAEAASSAAPVASGTVAARIETAPEAVSAVSVGAPELASAAPAGSSAASATSVTVAMPVPQVAAALPASVARADKPSTARPPAKPVARAHTKPAAPPVMASRLATHGATSTANSTAGNTSKEADVMLLSALLEHVGRDGRPASAPAPAPARAAASQDKMTIAQIVRRCEALGAKNTKEARECRRQICDGYWGKAQACPAHLAPKKG